MPSLAAILLSLKIIGVIGAFAGFSAERGATKDSVSAVARPKSARTWAIVFLSLAIFAEVTDFLLRRLEAGEQSERFERLIHPLGTIYVSASYTMPFDSPELKDFKKRLDATNGAAQPDRDKDPLADKLYRVAPSISVSINGKNHKSPVPPKSDAEDFYTEYYDLTFNVQADPRIPVARLAAARSYRYENGRILATLDAIPNEPNGRYSNGDIVSTMDLLGATLNVMFCPSSITRSAATIDSKISAVIDAVRPVYVMVDFPGHRTLALQGAEIWRVVQMPFGTCYEADHTFPLTFDQLDQELWH